MSELRYVGVTSNPGGAPPYRLLLATPSGRIREVELKPNDLSDLLRGVALIVTHQLKKIEQ
jgi:hypothetical protein